jgi:hypothetical protein
VIIVRFKGGLGNQLFQYAAGRALAERHGVPLRFDARWYDTVENCRTITRTFDLPAFNVEGRLATKDELDAFAFDESRKLWPRIRRKFLPVFAEQAVWSCDLSGWQPQFMRLGSQVMLDGYFQHPLFFGPVGADLRRELCLHVDPPRNIAVKAGALASQSAVCIQIRRTDFVNDPTTAGKHGSCSLNYFREAWSYVRERVPNARGYVFTDDMAWATEAFINWDDISVIGPEFNGPAYLHRFFLMRACSHFVIANSTWGWWAAWLGAKANSIVVLPKKWLRDEDTEARGLALPAWKVL